MPKISQSAAISQAESAALKWYNSNKAKIDNKTYTGVLNTGADDDDWVDSDLQETIRKAWIKKGDWNGLERRASLSSGENKFDLKFAIEGNSKSCFNYHVFFRVDDTAEKEREKQSAKDKQIAKDFQAKQQKEKEDAEEKKKAQASKEKDEQARMKKVVLAANTAWNTFKSTKAWNKTIVENDWKKQWIKDNQAKIK